jgi:hypothetical protein
MHSADMAQNWMLPNPGTSGHGPTWQLLVEFELSSAQQTWPGRQLEESVQALHTVIGSDGSVASGPHVSPCGQSADESQSWNVMAKPYATPIKNGLSSWLSSLPSAEGSLPSGDALRYASPVCPLPHAIVVAESVPTRRA